MPKEILKEAHPKVRYRVIRNNLDFIKFIASIAGEKATNEKVDQWAEKLKTPEAIFEFVQTQVKYTRDPITMDTIRHPQVLLERVERHGVTYADCDCKSTLLASLLLNRGYPVRFIAAHIILPGETSKDYYKINHTYLEFRDVYGATPDKWIALEPSAKKVVKMGYVATNVIDIYRVYVTVRGHKVEGES